MHTNYSQSSLSISRQHIIKSTHKSQQKQLQGFSFPTDKQDTLYCIWDIYKTLDFARVQGALYNIRCKAVMLMMQFHKLMKLPLQTLYLAVSVYDRVLLAHQDGKDKSKTYCQIKFSFSPSVNLEQEDIDFDILGIACLYSCQKLQKIRNYGVNHWLKHFSHQNLLSLGYKFNNVNGELLRKYEAYIMKKTNYNLLTSTVFDIVLAVWTLKPPTQKQFYFAQYISEIYLFCHFNIQNRIKSNNKFNNRDTATTINENNQIDMETQHQENSNPNTNKTKNIKLIDIALAIVQISAHFFGKVKINCENLVKNIYDEYQQEQHIKQLSQKLSIIKSLGNQLFQKVLNSKDDVFLKKIQEKYRKQVNLSISKYNFSLKIQNLVVTPQLKPTKKENYNYLANQFSYRSV